jgi:hypothetical protein
MTPGVAILAQVACRSHVVQKGRDRARRGGQCSQLACARGLLHVGQICQIWRAWPTILVECHGLRACRSPQERQHGHQRTLHRMGASGKHWTRALSHVRALYRILQGQNLNQASHGCRSCRTSRRHTTWRMPSARFSKRRSCAKRSVGKNSVSGCARLAWDLLAGLRELSLLHCGVAKEGECPACSSSKSSWRRVAAGPRTL